MAKENIFYEIERLGGLLHEYSTFDREPIGYALAELATTISGKRFEYLESRYYDGYVEYVSPLVVESEEAIKESYKLSPGTIECLAMYGHAIRFSRHSNDVSFYCSDGSRNGDSVGFNYGKLYYVDDFIRSIVQYRYEKGKATKNDINVCLKKFLNDHKAKYTQKNSSLKLTK